MPAKVDKQLDDDAQVFLKALIRELNARDEFTRLARRLKDKSTAHPDDQQCYRDLCVARRAIQLAERRHYRAYRHLIRHFEL
jgi:hypothetical protein